PVVSDDLHRLRQARRPDLPSEQRPTGVPVQDRVRRGGGSVGGVDGVGGEHLLHGRSCLWVGAGGRGKEVGTLPPASASRPLGAGGERQETPPTPWGVTGIV